MLEKNKYLSPTEQQKLLSYWKLLSKGGGYRNCKTYMFISFCLGSGLRAGEVANTEVGDLELSSEFACIKVKTLKNGSENPVYISQKLARQLKFYVKKNKLTGFLFASERGGKITPAALWHQWSGALKRANLPHFKLHSSRHSFITNLYRSTKDIVMCQKQARHKSINSTQIYADVSVEEISKVMDQL